MRIKRTLEDVVKANLFKGKAVILYGARQVGKTTLVKKIAEDSGQPYGYLNCDELDVLSRLQNAENSESLKQVTGDYRLVIIDEAQRVKDIGLKIKLLVDNFPEKQIIATGSSSFDLSNIINEPLTGRSVEFWLFPLSLNELFDKSKELEMQRGLENLLIYGSYPEIYQLESTELKSQRIKYLAANYLYKDILKFNNIKSSEVVLKLLQALALQIGNEVSYNELANLVGVNRQTIASYIELLEKAFIIFRLPPYSGNLRKALGKMRKIYFLDLGIRNAIINNQNPINLRDDIGKLWENFIIAEKYKQQLGPGFKTNYYFWRTYDKQEVDLVEEKRGRLLGWEIKWSGKNKKPPKAWRSYKNSSWYGTVNRDNYLKVLIEGVVKGTKKSELVSRLDGKVERTIRFINDVLRPRKDTDSKLLDEFRNVLVKYQKQGEVRILKELREIDSRPAPEGAVADYTTGTSLPLDGQYISLMELLMDIEDLAVEIERELVGQKITAATD